MTKITELALQVEHEVDRLVKEAWNKGFNEGVGITIPSQREFDEFHKMPQSYGEDGDWLVLSKSFYTEEEAKKILTQYFIDEGWHNEGDDEIDYILTSLSVRGIGYKRSPYEDEPMYWIPSKSENPTTFWEAWVVETDF